MLNNTLKECKNTTDKIPIIIKSCRQCGKTYQKKLPPWKIFSGAGGVLVCYISELLAARSPSNISPNLSR